jgi:hypothetical protein
LQVRFAGLFLKMDAVLATRFPHNRTEKVVVAILAIAVTIFII